MNEYRTESHTAGSRGRRLIQSMSTNPPSHLSIASRVSSVHLASSSLACKFGVAGALFSHENPVFSQRRVAGFASAFWRRLIHSSPTSDHPPSRPPGGANASGLRRLIHSMSDWPQSRRAARWGGEDSFEAWLFQRPGSESPSGCAMRWPSPPDIVRPRGRRLWLPSFAAAWYSPGNDLFRRASNSVPAGRRTLLARAPRSLVNDAAAATPAGSSGFPNGSRFTTKSTTTSGFMLTDRSRVLRSPAPGGWLRSYESFGCE